MEIDENSQQLLFETRHEMIILKFSGNWVIILNFSIKSIPDKL